MLLFFMGIELLSIATNDDTSTVRTQDSEPSFPKSVLSLVCFYLRLKQSASFQYGNTTYIRQQPNTTQIEEKNSGL